MANHNRSSGSIDAIASDHNRSSVSIFNFFRWLLLDHPRVFAVQWWRSPEQKTTTHAPLSVGGIDVIQTILTDPLMPIRLAFTRDHIKRS